MDTNETSNNSNETTDDTSVLEAIGQLTLFVGTVAISAGAGYVIGYRGAEKIWNIVESRLEKRKARKALHVVKN